MLVLANTAVLLLVLQRVVEEMEGPQGPVSNSLHGDLAPSSSDGEVFAAPDNLHVAIPHLQSTLAGEPGTTGLSCARSGSVRMSHTPSWGRCGASSSQPGRMCQGAAPPGTPHLCSHCRLLLHRACSHGCDTQRDTTTAGTTCSPTH